MKYSVKGVNPTEIMKSIKANYGHDVGIIQTIEHHDCFEVFFTTFDDPAHPEHENDQLPAQTVTDTQPISVQPSISTPVEQSLAEKAPVTPALDSHQIQAIEQQQKATESLLEQVSKMSLMLNEQMKMANWNSWSTGNQLKGKTWQTLTESGFSPHSARAIVDALPAEFTEHQSLMWTLDVIATKLARLQPTTEILKKGGVYALVGPTGTGKTTTIAKMAARAIGLNGKGSVALVTIDTLRIGAIEQLRTYAKILSVPVHVVKNAAELQHTLDGLKDKHLVLIDTAGIGPKDPKAYDHLSTLSGTQVSRLLVLNASLQAEILDDIVDRFKSDKTEGVIITKMDETHKIGGSVDVALRHNLPVLYVTTGQRVPEDMYTADPNFLSKNCLKSPPKLAFTLTEQEKTWQMQAQFSRLQESFVPQGSIH